MDRPPVARGLLFHRTAPPCKLRTLSRLKIREGCRTVGLLWSAQNSIDVRMAFSGFGDEALRGTNGGKEEEEDDDEDLLDEAAESKETKAIRRYREKRSRGAAAAAVNGDQKQSGMYGIPQSYDSRLLTQMFSGKRSPHGCAERSLAVRAEVERTRGSTRTAL